MIDMNEFSSINQLISKAVSQGKSVADIMIEQEVKTSGLSYEKVWQKMERNLSTMESAVKEGVEGVESTTGLTGGDAFKMKRYIESGRGSVSYTHLTLPTILRSCRSRWSPYH